MQKGYGVCLTHPDMDNVFTLYGTAEELSDAIRFADRLLPDSNQIVCIFDLSAYIQTDLSAGLASFTHLPALKPVAVQKNLFDSRLAKTGVFVFL